MAKLGIIFLSISNKSCEICFLIKIFCTTDRRSSENYLLRNSVIMDFIKPFVKNAIRGAAYIFQKGFYKINVQMCHQYIENDINEMRNLEIKICIEYLFWYILLEIFEVTFYEVTRRHGCSPVNLLHIFRTSFSKSTYGKLLLMMIT